MNPKDSSEITVQTLLALRQESEALRLITEKLRVKEMGPADHIRTKHEVKLFIETGDATVAASLRDSEIEAAALAAVGNCSWCRRIAINCRDANG